MKLATILFSATAALASSKHAKHCDKSDYEALGKAIAADAHYTSCAADVGIAEDKFATTMAYTPEQADAFSASDNCKQLYSAVQAASAKQGCVELTYMSKVTWPMATSIVEVGSYPKATTPCDSAELQSLAAPLLNNANIMPCFTAAGLYGNLFTNTVPTHEQLEKFAASPFCRDLFNDAQKIVAGLPHCAADRQGNDIRSIEKLDFDNFVAWAEFVADYLQDQVAPQLMSLALSAIQPATYESSSSSWAVPGAAAAGFGMAFVAMYVHKKVQGAPERMGESTGLLHI